MERICDVQQTGRYPADTGKERHDGSYLENLERAARMGFDFIQTDHEAQIADLLRKK